MKFIFWRTVFHYFLVSFLFRQTVEKLQAIVGKSVTKSTGLVIALQSAQMKQVVN
jgi:hypothetical protein